MLWWRRTTLDTQYSQSLLKLEIDRKDNAEQVVAVFHTMVWRASTGNSKGELAINLLPSELYGLRAQIYSCKSVRRGPVRFQSAVRVRYAGGAKYYDRLW